MQRYAIDERRAAIEVAKMLLMLLVSMLVVLLLQRWCF